MSHYFFKKGFTLIELVVSIGIISVVLTIILLNQSTYTERITLTNLADEIALEVSQAQAYGIGVQEFTPGSANFSISYGLSLSLIDPSYKTSYIFFADRNGNRAYDDNWSCPAEGTSECLEKVDILRGNHLDTVCMIPLSGVENCYSAWRADVSFTRPNPEAEFMVFNWLGQNFNAGTLKGIRYVLKSPGGLTRSVAIYQNGQISVQ